MPTMLGPFARISRAAFGSAARSFASAVSRSLFSGVVSQPAHQSQRDEKRRRLHAVQRDRRRQVVARKPESALRAAFRLDRDAERNEPVDVAVDGAHRDLEARPQAASPGAAAAVSGEAGSPARAPADSRKFLRADLPFLSRKPSRSNMTSGWQVSHPILAPQTGGARLWPTFQSTPRQASILVDRVEAWLAEWRRIFREIRLQAKLTRELEASTITCSATWD